MDHRNSLKGQKIVCPNIRSLYAKHSQLEADFKDSNIYGLPNKWYSKDTRIVPA